MGIATFLDSGGYNPRQRKRLRGRMRRFEEDAHLSRRYARKGGPMWIRRDWDEFFNRIRKRGTAVHPPRPVDRSARNRLVPAEGYSLAELDDAGLSLEQAEVLGLPVDALRVGSDQANVTALQMFLRASRTRY